MIMMTYHVIKSFTDLQDNDHPYNVGDVFPRDGMTVTAERFAELAGSDNKQRTPLIKADTEPVAEPVAEVTDDVLAEEQPEEETPKRKGRKKSE